MIEVTTDTGVFRLIKDVNKHQIYWICKSGYYPGSTRSNNLGLIVPTSFNNNLNILALSQGYNPEDLRLPEKVRVNGKDDSVKVKIDFKIKRE